MKKLVVATLILSGLAFSAISHAEKNTISIGYAQSKVQDFKNINGVNVKYRYEWDSPISVIGSFTYMSGKESDAWDYSLGRINTETKVNYYSLAAGPAWRYNEFISFYGLLGINFNKIEYNEKYVSAWSNRRYEESEDKSALMYGVGVQLNPVEYLAVDIGYEGSRVKVGNQNHSVNGFNIGIGYSF